MSFKVEVKTNNGIEYSSNAIRLGTMEEAKAYGLDLFTRWSSVTDYRAVASTDPVNYRWVDGKLEAAT